MHLDRKLLQMVSASVQLLDEKLEFGSHLQVRSGHQIALLKLVIELRAPQKDVQERLEPGLPTNLVQVGAGLGQVGQQRRD